MLCEVCQKLFRGRFHKSDSLVYGREPYQTRIHLRHPHQARITDLRRAALEECTICLILWEKCFEDYWRRHVCHDNATIEEKSQMLIEDIYLDSDEAHHPEPFLEPKEEVDCKHAGLSTKTLDENPNSSGRVPKSFVVYRYSTSDSHKKITPERDLVYNSRITKIDLEFWIQFSTVRSTRTSRWGNSTMNDAYQAFKLDRVIKDKAQVASLNINYDREWPKLLAKRWLQDCLSSHSFCHPHKQSKDSSKQVPTRLLEVFLQEGDNWVRLIHTQENLAVLDAQYVTLSHCWGTLKIPTLTRDSFYDLASGVRASSLPKTFRDAVEMTLLLGANYLWIDSLCILQDSEEDWVREASVMGSVYSNGLCNLAASISVDASGGLFHSSRPTVRRDCFVESFSEDGINNLWHVYPPDFHESQLFNSPLMQRGWVVQERLLSRRVLHFGLQMYWECHQHAACETHLDGFPDLKENFHLSTLKPNYQVLGVAVPHGFLPTAAGFHTVNLARLKLWHTIVQDYTSCDLTIQNDKLIAISGLAKAFLSSMKAESSDYLAGLWRMNLIPELCWYMQQRRTQSKVYRAPSWSWASLDGKTSVIKISAEDSGLQIAETLEASVEPLGSDPTGALKSGSIRLQGPLMTIEFRWKNDSHRLDYYGDWKINGRWTEENLVYKDHSETHRNLHCMPLLWPKRNLRREKMACSLILQPTGVQKGQFRRVGFMYFACRPHAIDYWAGWGSLRNDDWFEFEEHVGDGIYRITIV
ncbi:heterokaryon incompatibility protein-domain-containing protein [Bisporella sp. PMI_857]|nr:heterokaryon incompatibility protein-domain-containing protein [Bisporella sp. PMI_857]